MFFLQTSVIDKTSEMVSAALCSFAVEPGCHAKPPKHRSLTEQRVLGYNKAV